MVRELKGELGRFVETSFQRIDRVCEAEDIVLTDRQREVVVTEVQTLVCRVWNLAR